MGQAKVNQHTDPTAVLGRRLIAWVLDNLIVATLFTIILLSGAENRQVPDGVSNTDACSILFTSDEGCIVIGNEAWQVDVGLSAAHVLFPTLAFLANQILLTAATGFSLGKAVTGLRVVRRSDGGLPGLTGAAGRTLPWMVPTILGLLAPVMVVIEIGLTVTSTGHRRLGDRIGGTLVVDRSRSGTVPLVPGLNNPDRPT
ncbi:MAG TPA: hypothetical protein DF783_05395 [Acidimicrobiaceae bacterium]|jgi:uncharacterized RDD family membrane protein YckC|nr:hypothetical protein [Acidimicrobiaceae bacterium]MDP7259050.1 RDD family protein [Acidimicrobiales bacterium]HCV36342.1 hypothetical protein [Acidimicrobiaceae bacterium]HJO80591.1 RDD family protein [Acidimicrobiales bacterium]|tara:strand:+ start:13195 stop:13794 length:600 start_codon:yes stop_codon:yes gene_type:complete